MTQCVSPLNVIRRVVRLFLLCSRRVAHLQSPGSSFPLLLMRSRARLVLQKFDLFDLLHLQRISSSSTISLST